MYRDPQFLLLRGLDLGVVVVAYIVIVDDAVAISLLLHGSMSSKAHQHSHILQDSSVISKNELHIWRDPQLFISV